MSDLEITIPKETVEVKNNSLTFEIHGNAKYGLDKTIVNGLRRTLLSSIPSIAFKTARGKSDINIVTNNTALHNEFMLHRIAMIPLYINPDIYKKNLLFYLKVKNTTTGIMTITSKDFDIYKIKEDVLKKCEEEDDYSSLDNVSPENYNMNEKLSDSEKKKIFRPFEIEDMESYCLIIELSTNNSEDVVQELELYGSPSLGYGNMNARWQAVSCATYSFKEDKILFDEVAKEKIKVNEISENKDKFVRELKIAEGERYFKRDLNLQPYWYNFRIDSQSYFPPNNSSPDGEDGLLVKSGEILVKTFEELKDEFKKLLYPDVESIMEIKVDPNNELIYKIIVNGGNDTIGSIIQAHMTNKMINDKSVVSFCGYKKLHPLEEIITFTLALNSANKIVKSSTLQKVNTIIEGMVDCCNEISLIYQEIIKTSKKI